MEWKTPMPDVRADREQRAELYRAQARLAAECADRAENPEVREEFLKVATEWLKLATEIENFLT